MKGVPEISVIVPVYNAARWLRRCINSILSQSYTNFEIILIDDGSLDNSSEICKEYVQKDSRVRFFSRSNHGVGSTRNYGIDKAYGRWICFVDADDWIEKNHLSSFFPANLTIKEDTLVSQGILFDFSETKKTDPFFEYSDIEISTTNIEEICKYYILHNGCPYCKLYNTGIIKKNKLVFDETLTIHEDHCFVLDYIKYVKTIRLSSSLSYHYMQNEQNEQNDGSMSLTHRRHSAVVYLRASLMLRKRFMELPTVTENMNHPYVQSAVMKYGIRQLLSAYSVMDRSCSISVMREVRKERKRVVEYLGLKGVRRILYLAFFMLPTCISASIVLCRRSFRY